MTETESEVYVDWSWLYLTWYSKKEMSWKKAKSLQAKCEEKKKGAEGEGLEIPRHLTLKRQLFMLKWNKMRRTLSKDDSLKLNIVPGPN